MGCAWAAADTAAASSSPSEQMKPGPAAPRGCSLRSAACAGARHHIGCRA